MRSSQMLVLFSFVATVGALSAASGRSAFALILLSAACLLGSRRERKREDIRYDDFLKKLQLEEPENDSA